MNSSKATRIIAEIVVIITLQIGAYACGITAGKDSASEEWRQRTQEAGFNLVTRYDQITGQPRLVLIPVNKSEIK